MKAAAAEFAEEKGLSEDNFDWLFHSRTGEQRELTSGAWKAIANNALPHRSVRAVWACGTRILHPSHSKVSPCALSAATTLAFSSLQWKSSTKQHQLTEQDRKDSRLLACFLTSVKGAKAYLLMELLQCLRSGEQICAVGTSCTSS